MDAFFTSVALSAIAGLGYIAVRHPKVYEEVLFSKLYLAAVVVLLTMFMWSAGAEVTLNTLTPYIEAKKLAEAKQAAASVTIRYEVAVLLSFGIFGYLLLLSWLATHIAKDQKQTPSSKQ